MARNLPALPVRQRAHEWIRRLERTSNPRWAAADLYAGDHWTAAARLPDLGVGQGYMTVLWVLSAGYGLIPSHLPIAPYAATFSSSSPDSVGTSAESPAWWDVLTSETSIAPGHHRSLTAIATADPTARILVVAALPYLHPIAADAAEAARRLSSDEQLMVVSAGARSSGNGLSPFLLPLDSRLTQIVGGSRISLNARAAAFVVETASETGLTRTTVSEFLATRLADLPAQDIYDRTPMADDEVVAYIHDRLTVDPHLSATRLLRDLRDGGRACEQQRFHDLVREVRGSYA
jgi:hypothetical protein